VDVSVAVAEGTSVGKDCVGVASKVGVDSRGAGVNTGVVVGDGVSVSGGMVARGVGVSEIGGGAVTSAMIPRQ
jgi:hypothetical protein